MTKSLSILLVVLSLVACGRDDETEVSVPTPSGGPEPAAQARLSVSEVRVGTAAEEPAGVTQEAAAFGAADTVFVSARLEGEIDQANVVARWMGPDGTEVHAEERFLPLEGEETVVFHLAPPAGFAPGAYRVQLLLGGQPVGQAEFTVQP